MIKFQKVLCSNPYILKTTNAPVIYNFSRKKCSLSLWNEKLTNEIKHKIEGYWANEVSFNKKPSVPFVHYCLPMFLNPSGKVQMKHVRLLSISDALCRYNKLNGNEWIQPIGWNSFGSSMPAEEEMEHDVPTEVQITAKIKTMKEELVKYGFDLNWNNEIKISDPQYYKWTQYIFLKLYEKGLVYQKKDEVNWDPIEKTVLAYEQVDGNGCSLISGAKVQKKISNEWYIRTTQYAKDLYDSLENIELDNCNDIMQFQKNLIGKCNGIVVRMSLKFGDKSRSIDVWSTDPYKFIHGDYIAIKEQSITLIDISDHHKRNLKCYNPITNSEMMVYITNEINYPEGKDVYIACPSFDSEDKKISSFLKVPINPTKQIINIEAENIKAAQVAKAKQCGGYAVSSKLRDWLVSKDKFWGTPIPIVHCSNCGTVLLPYEELPVELPNMSSNNLKHSNLSNFETWVNCKCPKCLGDAKRETSTMDAFVDSSWYLYRSLDSSNDKLPFDFKQLPENFLVKYCIWDSEHIQLYLYYARFMSHFLCSNGFAPTKKPYDKLIVQGVMMGQSYKLKSTGKYLPSNCVEKIEKKYKEKGSGELVTIQWEEFCKSKYNEELPQDIRNMYGSDTIRLIMLSYVKPQSNKKWSTSVFPRTLNWQEELWTVMREFLSHKNNNSLLNVNNITEDKLKQYESTIWEARNNAIALATYHFKYTQNINTVISELQHLSDTVMNKIPPEVVAKSKQYEHALANLIVMLSPMAPHFCSELWAGLSSAPRKALATSTVIDWSKGVFEQKWPVVDLDYPLLIEYKLNGQKRYELKLEASEFSNLTAEKALEMMLEEENFHCKLLVTDFEVFPNCHAVLHVTNKKQKVQKQI